jgi:hypothetical protein
MSRSSIFYALVCLGLIALYTAAARNGYSPFAQGGARPFFVYGSRGPTHK